MDLATSPLVSPTNTKSSTSPRLPRRRSWQARYANLLTILDSLVVVLAVFVTQFLWLGPAPASVGGAPIDYTTASILLSAGWLAALTLWGTRLPRVVGQGIAEHRLVIAASFQLFGLVAIAAYLAEIDLSRGYFLLSLPLGTLTLLVARTAARRWLVARRRKGDMSARVVLVGSADENARVSAEIMRQPGVGLTVVGLHQVDSDDGTTWTDAHARTLQRRLDALDADSVLITGGGQLDAQDIRRIGWGLEPGRQHLIVAVNLTDVAGPRIHTRPVAGLPLVHVETPQYSTRQRVLKRAFDIVASLFLLVALSPLLLVLGALVRLSGPGPVFYRQERVGQGGTRFGMFKFRSMFDGADARLSELLSAQGRDGSPLFKIENDPRITPIGRVLRRYSLDEIPQLFNVLAGQMSLVGPRPQREAEVAFYDDDARRRLIVRPGMSGLWQVSGRSTLPWQEAIRLDLFYVENWSLIGDIVILFRTVKAVVAPGDTAH
jgi:exopolysaccharide biosynthesis polyprenyl glycosylphosphotransferase